MLKILEQMGTLILLIGAGAGAARLGIVDGHSVASLNKLIMRLCFPAMILANMDKSFSSAMLQTSLWLLLISAVCYSVLVAGFEVWRKCTKRNPRDLSLLQFLILVGNTAFMGYPVVNAIYGSDGIFLASVFNIVHNFVVYSYGFFLLKRGDKIKFGRILLNSAFICTVVGFALFLAPFTLPYVIHYPLEWVGNMTIPLSLLVVGHKLAHTKPRDLLYPRFIWQATAIRLLLFPAILLPVLYGLGLRGTLLVIPVTIFATPIGLTVGTMVAQYGGDDNAAGKAVVLSNFLSVITLPLLIILLMRLAG